MIVQKYNDSCTPGFGNLNFTRYFIETFQIELSIRCDGEIFIHPRSNINKNVNIEKIEIDDNIIKKYYQIFLDEQKLKDEKMYLYNEIIKLKSNPEALNIYGNNSNINNKIQSNIYDITRDDFNKNWVIFD